MSQAIFKASKKETGGIGPCEICKNRAELCRIPDDARSMCGDCADAMLHGMNKKEQAAKQKQVVQTSSVVPPSEERASYMETITQNITDDQKKDVISALVEKGVFFYDFDQVIANERWMTVLDLRKLAATMKPKAVNRATPQAKPSKPGGAK